MFILLRHFPHEKRAIIKIFNKLLEIEDYMESKIETTAGTGFYDYYSGSSVMHRVLTKKPKYDGVIGFIRDFDDEGNGIIYKIEFINLHKILSSSIYKK